MAASVRPPLSRITTTESRPASTSSQTSRREAGSPVDVVAAQETPPAGDTSMRGGRPSVASSAAAVSAQPQHAGLQPPLVSGYIKASMPYDSYHNVVGLRVLHLLDADATSTRVLMSETQKQGTFGKLKYGYDSAHERIALKEMRMMAAQPAGALSKFGHPKTLPMSADEVLLEAERTTIVRSVIDSHIAAAIATKSGQDPLGAVRSKVTAFHVHEVIDTGTKMYMVTTAESGDLADLAMTVTSTERPGFALSAAAQAYFEVGAMHAVGFVHLDIKKDNMVFTEHGQIKLVDFGLACSRVEGESHVGLRGPRGTNPAPEMLLTDDDLDEDGNWQSVLLTEAVDVWLTAITTLQLLDPKHDRDNPLMYVLDAHHNIDYVATSTRLAHFEVWRREALTADGHVRPEALREDNVFSRYFQRVHRVNSGLCDVLLSRALVARVDLRATAKQMTQATLQLVQQLAPLQQKQTRDVFARGHQSLGQPAVYAALDRYQKWLAANS